MDSGTPKPGWKPQGSNEASLAETPKSTSETKPTITSFKLLPSSKGVENAKKRLRAFSIQKKTPLTPVAGPSKVLPGGSNAVIIGKLTGAKSTLKPEEMEQKKVIKPPKPGAGLQDCYTVQRRRTLTEIEEMKHKMELIDLGIPLGLIYPASSSDKAMPTKAMPPIKSFLDQSKLDKIISEAKKAKAEGKTFKFDYNKLLPDYDNPFQRKKYNRKSRQDSEKSEEHEYTPEETADSKKPTEKKGFKKLDKWNEKRVPNSYKKAERDVRSVERDRETKTRERSKDKNERRDKKERKESEKSEKDPKETDVNLNDYLVCDSWSLDNEDKTSTSSPHVEEKPKTKETVVEDEKPVEGIQKEETPEDPPKVERLQPVMDSFKFEIDEDEILDMFDETTEIEKFTKKIPKKGRGDSPIDMKFLDSEATKDSNDMSLTDDTFLESVINEIKQEAMSDDESRDKGLVEYDSPLKNAEYSPGDRSITPELDDRMRNVQSSRSDYSDGYRSTESGYKSTESGRRSTDTGYKSKDRYKWETEKQSGHKSTESKQKSSSKFKSLEIQSDRYRMSMDKEDQVQRATMDSLETWSFVMKICQPLLFRHDRNHCYKETRVAPKLWFTENPKVCSCVKDRAIVYEELEMCKMDLVDRVYGCDQIPDVVPPKTRTWYPQLSQCLSETSGMQELSEWEAEDSQADSATRVRAEEPRRSATPRRGDEVYLDREYQRFMEAVWPEVSETKSNTSRSTTPVRQEGRKKKKTEDGETEEKKRAKKMKLSSEGWSQESDIEEDVDKSKKTKTVEKEKTRKRKHSSSRSDSESETKRKKKASKKKTHKKKKVSDKRRRLKNKLKKLKELKRKKMIQAESDDDDKETRKKLKKKKLQKKKKVLKKKSKPKSSSSSSTSSSDSSDSDEKRIKKKSKKKKRKQSTSESTQSEEIFDVNILNNIKTEILTDDEKHQKLDFSPRRKPKETIKQIINVKELQNDFVGNNIHVKQEKKEETSLNIEKSSSVEQTTECSNEPVECISVPVECISLPGECISVPVECISLPGERINVPVECISLPGERINVPVECISLPGECSETVENSETVESRSENTESSNITEMEVKYEQSKEDSEFKEPQITPLSTPQIRQDDTSHSQSSQDSSVSKDQVPYEKDDSHLRPSSQNSNYSFNDVINASHPYHKEEEEIEEMPNYEQGNYEMYEQLAMAYQSDVAKQPPSSDTGAEWWESRDGGGGSQRIETVVCARARGEIKCDWRAGDPARARAAARTDRPSRWGLKPGQVNIVLTGGYSEPAPPSEPVYQIQSLANRTQDNNSTGYDEAYEDMYGASDRLQYGDCFGDTLEQHSSADPPAVSTLDGRIDQVLRDTVLGQVANDVDESERTEADGGRKKNTKSGGSTKRVSFADGYQPGQDSDLEEPPLRKRKRGRRLGCAWPCPASHPDHVPLWDALPPPPPPPGDPPALPVRTMPPALAMPPRYNMTPKHEPGVSLPSFMPPEPPPGILAINVI